jgi:hypothetical protein
MDIWKCLMCGFKNRNGIFNAFDLRQAMVKIIVCHAPVKNAVILSVVHLEEGSHQLFAAAQCHGLRGVSLAVEGFTH